VLAALALGAAVLPSPSSAADAARVAGRLVLRGRAGLSADALQDTLQRTGARQLGQVAAVDATVIEAPEPELAAVVAALRRSGLFKSVERDYVAKIADDPNDPEFSAQWGVSRIGAPAAWAVSSGAGTVVAVIDTGVDATHPDLQGQVLAGYDFVNDDADPADDHGHGTRMSGIIAARLGNGEGGVGVAPDARVLPVKVLAADGYGTYSNVANGIVYAVDHGARILNLSLTGPVRSAVLQDAVDYATAHDAVVVAAAGNAGTDAPAYPAAANGAVAIGAINANDVRPSFSNYGAWLSVVAPGVDIVTTSLDGTYASSSGTSPAAAVASGVFALLFAHAPTLARLDAIDRVQRGALDLGSRGWDEFYGWGVVDAYAALVPGQIGAPPLDDTAPHVALLSPARRSLLWGMVPVDVAANDDVAVTRVELFVDNRRYAMTSTSPYQFVVDAGHFGAGPHKLRADAYDARGNYGKSRTINVTFTPGVGLLVRRAVARDDSITVTADFALPAGATFDPLQNGLVITLTSSAGTVLSAVADAGVLRNGGRGRTAQGVIAPVVPSSGRIRLLTKDGGAQPIYTLKMKASQLADVGQMASLMNLAVAAGGTQLSQSLTFRTKGSTLIYP
jgi:subtilisin family serine protease